MAYSPLIKSMSLAAAGSAGCSYELHGINIGTDEGLFVESDNNNVNFIVAGVRVTIADGTKRLMKIFGIGIDSSYGIIEAIAVGETYTHTVSVFTCNLDESNPSSFSIYVGTVPEEI